MGRCVKKRKEIVANVEPSPVEAPMLEARHLVKRFFGTAVVNDVSFDVRAGEVIGYLGLNGSGKSTTAKMLTGLVEPSAGAVLFDGQDIALDPVAFRRRFGYVPEEPNLYTFQSAIEYLELVGRLRELPSALLTRKIGALLDLFGLSHAANQQLVLRADPERTAADIADVVTDHA